MQRLADLDLSLELKLELSFDAPTLTAKASFDAEKTLPSQVPHTLKAGWLRTKPMTEKNLRSLAENLAPNLANVIANAGFDVSPKVEQAHITIYCDEEQVAQQEIERGAA